MSSSPKRNLCNLCSKRVNANSKAIQCFRKSHQKCISNLGTSDANDKACLHSNYFCVKCVKNTLPFMSLKDNEFQTAIFELQHGSSYFWNYLLFIILRIIILRPIEFSLIHFNIRSLRKHFNDIICYLTALDFHFDAIALSETFLNSNDDIELTLED